MTAGRTARLALAAALLGCLSACAPKTVASVAPASPQYPDFVYPAVPDPAPAGVADLQQRAWFLLQGGDLRGAERGFTALVRNRPGFVPAESGLGYVALARTQAADALQRFDQVLHRQPAYAPALAGRAQALAALGRDAEALAAYEAAAAADPTLDLGARIEVLRIRGAGDTVGDARRAAERGRLDEARQKYEAAIAASPDSAFLHRELAAVNLRAGREADALAGVRRALELDPSDARASVLLGDLLLARGQFDDAARAYEAAEAADPSPETERKLEDARRRGALARLPPEYQALSAAAEVTRGDVAAALGVQLGALLPPAPGRQGVVVTDIRGHWAATWILAVVRAGVMEPFPNHTFQPRQRVRRADFAQIAARVLAIAASRRSSPPDWQSARLTIADVGPSHPLYPAVSRVVAAGVLSLGPGDAFQPGRPLTGAELLAAVSRLQALTSGQRRGP